MNLLEEVTARQISRLRHQAKTVISSTPYEWKSFPSDFRHKIFNHPFYKSRVGRDTSEDLRTTEPSIEEGGRGYLQTPESLLFAPIFSSPIAPIYSQFLGYCRTMNPAKLSYLRLTLMLEMCMICDWVIDDCVVLGDWGSPEQTGDAELVEWHCLILPSKGPYRGQLITFKLAFTSDYPDGGFPKCIFLDTIPSHPLIALDSGELDLQVLFGEPFKAEKHCIVQMLAKIRIMFRNPIQQLTTSDLTDDQKNTLIKQPDFITKMNTQGADVAAKPDPAFSKAFRDPILESFLSTSGSTPEEENIQRAVKRICEKLAKMDVNSGFSRGVNFQHDELTAPRIEADQLLDKLLDPSGNI
eukprot:Blabericola_migrator_1__11201@NODE_657_length_7016_cov_177_727587_g481_i0_p4_GENE_NODE_657_length_7016_cov_177_727587_g481_i0NODE_657_length_7016_cov_177_727587_g481_i0_p4_ORF_typecomplete_len355_score51_94UQ_con/PF00179_26/9_6e09_NODE_657_length_7016_cov_177_727587_g481_i06201684